MVRGERWVVRRVLDFHAYWRPLRARPMTRFPVYVPCRTILGSERSKSSDQSNDRPMLAERGRHRHIFSSTKMQTSSTTWLAGRNPESY